MVLAEGVLRKILWLCGGKTRGIEKTRRAVDMLFVFKGLGGYARPRSSRDVTPHFVKHCRHRSTIEPLFKPVTFVSNKSQLQLCQNHF